MKPLIQILILFLLLFSSCGASFNHPLGQDKPKVEEYDIDGFWNWLKVKKGSQYNIDKKRFIKENEEEYNTEYYKNSYRKATEKEKQNYVVAFCNKY